MATLLQESSMALAPAQSPPSTLDLGGVLSESKRIINAHSRHFLALTVLFLLPLSFSVTVFPTIHQALLSRPGQSLLSSSDPSSSTALQIAVLYVLWLSLLSLCAAAAVTFSVFHGFYGRPVKFVSAIKSLSASFLPLLATAAFAGLAVLGLASAFWLLAFLVSGTLSYLGFPVSRSSPLLAALSAAALLPLLLLLAYLLVNWALAGVVSVVEKSWGIDPLRRSASLVKGMRRLSLSLLLFFGGFIGVLVWISSGSSLGFNASSGSDGWTSVAFVVQIVVTSALISLLLLHGLAATTVLYMYCKAVRGELAAEIAEEFAWEYVSLPFDAHKVPHVVSVVQP